jgi:hypothetical protein
MAVAVMRTLRHGQKPPRTQNPPRIHPEPGRGGRAEILRKLYMFHHHRSACFGAVVVRSARSSQLREFCFWLGHSILVEYSHRLGCLRFLELPTLQLCKGARGFPTGRSRHQCPVVEWNVGYGRRCSWVRYAKILMQTVLFATVSRTPLPQQVRPW